MVNGSTLRKSAEMTASQERFLPLYRFGWAFLLAWVFCVFYTQVVDGYIGGADSFIKELGTFMHLFFIGLPVFMSIVMLILIVSLEKRFGSPVDHRIIFLLAPLLTAISTPLLFVSTHDLALTTLLFVLGSILTGVGSGFLWVMWGEYYAKLSQEDVESLAPISAIIAAVLVLLVSAMSGWLALAIVTVFPLLSGLCFLLSWRGIRKHVATVEHVGSLEQRAYTSARDSAKASPRKVISVMGRAGLGILVACMFVCIAGSFWEAPDKNSLPFQVVILASILFVAIIAFFSATGPRRISIAFLYRWMCPLLVVGYGSMIVFGLPFGGYLAYLVAIAGRFAFCLITQMYFARFAASGRITAVQSYGLGWIFVHLGDFLGVLLFILVGSDALAGEASLNRLVIISIAILVIVTMFVLNDGSSFSSEAAASARAGVASAGSVCARTQQFSEDEVFAQKILSISERYELTPRETEVFNLLAKGRSIPFIRDALIISKETAATHAKHVYAKLGVHSRQELIDLID